MHYSYRTVFLSVKKLDPVLVKVSRESLTDFKNHQIQPLVGAPFEQSLSQSKETADPHLQPEQQYLPPTSCNQSHTHKPKMPDQTRKTQADLIQAIKLVQTYKKPLHTNSCTNITTGLQQLLKRFVYGEKCILHAEVKGKKGRNILKNTQLSHKCTKHYKLRIKTCKVLK